MNVKTLLLMQWATKPVARMPERHEFTQSKVYYCYENHYRIYDHFYYFQKKTLDQHHCNFLRIFNRRIVMSAADMERLMEEIDFELIKNSCSLWAYYDEENKLQITRQIKDLYFNAISGLTFVTNQCERYIRF
ncbi:hypothetical protein AhnVgp097 [Adoxophyes honmai nucleopolyhedrovirus]|uniref:Uncharacterized protein n=1 Tax=Adoxophyes honmai nucleopolyhedrovirus TaxID=224399 RepID=Q80LJ9_NPVAH|nr:hypothetical protein AhnVgp097 [Adoxophyes honmai nucleopolyhedrovirus]BAC67348.1 hypothetical protein [Adoxophyes honmai nucleopolyhedrovirus]